MRFNAPSRKLEGKLRRGVLQMCDGVGGSVFIYLSGIPQGVGCMGWM